MASETVPGADLGPAEQAQQGPLFRPFSWDGPATTGDAGLLAQAGLALAHDVGDLASGVQLVLRVLEREGLDDDNREDGDITSRPLFSEFDRDVLMRLAIVSAGSIQQKAENFRVLIRQLHREGVKL